MGGSKYALSATLEDICFYCHFYDLQIKTKLSGLERRPFK